MLIQPTVTTDTSHETAAVFGSNLLFVTLFLCPRPVSLGGSTFAPLPYRANPLALPSVFLGLMLGVAPTSLKQIVPALQAHRTPSPAYKAIRNALIETADDNVELSFPLTAKTAGIFSAIDHSFYDIMAMSHDTALAREYRLNAALEKMYTRVLTRHNKTPLELLSRHKRLASLPASMPSRKVAELV